MTISDALRNNRGGAFSIVIIGMIISIAGFLILVNSIDFAIYSYKRNIISKAIDYGVSAAVQEIDVERSKEGLAEGFDENGSISLDNVFLHEQKADNAFFSTFKENVGLSKADIESHTMIAIINPIDVGLSYVVKSKTSRYTGEISDPASLEVVLNSRIYDTWDTSDAETDKHIIYINGNVKTNEFKKRPYYLIFIKDYQIDGLFRRRTATFVGFKGAKIERKASRRLKHQ